MQDSIPEKIRLFLLHRIPLLTTIILMFLFYIPVNSFQLNYLRPMAAIICVFYWTLRRGYMFGVISAFIIGLIADIYSSSPLGVNIMMLMILSFITQWLSHYFSSVSFGAGWFIFGSVCIGFTLLKWIILSLYFAKVLNWAEVAFGCLATIMFYPLIAWINVIIQNKFLPQEHINE